MSPGISQNGTGIPLKYSEIKFIRRKNDGITVLQDARILAICKLHPARITVNQAADAVEKDNGFMQLAIAEKEEYPVRNSPFRWNKGTDKQ